MSLGRSTLLCAALAAMACFSLVSCDPDFNTDDLETDSTTYTDYKIVCYGTAEGMDLSKENVPMYYSATARTYVISGFFGGAGELAFQIEEDTSRLNVLNSYTGLYYSMYPMYVLPQSTYDQMMGEDAAGSYYYSDSGVYSFNVIIETADDYGTLVYFTEHLTFTVTSESK